jgi:hypothetical protein
MKTEDQPEPAAEEVEQWKTVPNREDLRRNKLTLRRRQAGHFRRQAIKRMRAGYEVLA